MEIFYCCFQFFFHFHFVFVCRLDVCCRSLSIICARWRSFQIEASLSPLQCVCVRVCGNAPGVPLLKLAWCLTLHCSTLLRLLSERIIFVYVRFKFHLWDAMHVCAFLSISNRFSFTHRIWADSSVNITTAMNVRKVRLGVRAHALIFIFIFIFDCANVRMPFSISMDHFCVYAKVSVMKDRRGMPM